MTESEFGTEFAVPDENDDEQRCGSDDKNAHKCDLCGFFVLLDGGFVNARQILYELFCWLGR